MKVNGRLGVLLLAMAAGLTGCVSGVFTGMTKELREHGVTAEATILKIWDTGWTVNEDPVIGMRVEVRPPDGPVFEATIAKTLISRIDLPQFQPGKVVPVRYDPTNRAVVAVDFEGQAASGGTGNPYHDSFVRAPSGAAFQPPQALNVYLGTGDSAADEVALVENGYALLGASAVEGGSDLQQAIAQGKEIGAAVVVVYGHFDVPGGSTLTVLPFQARSLDATERGQSSRSLSVDESIVPKLTASERAAFYFARMRPPILGVGLRALNDQERALLNLKAGVAVIAVTEGSPAEAAHIQRGDIIVAIDGKPTADLTGVPALLKSVAGRKVGFDLMRAGTPVSVDVQLNPAEP